MIDVEWDDEADCYASFSADIDIASSGYTLEEAVEHFKEAFAGHLEVSREYRKRPGISEAKARQLEKLFA